MWRTFFVVFAHLFLKQGSSFSSSQVHGPWDLVSISSGLLLIMFTYFLYVKIILFLDIKNFFSAPNLGPS